MKWNYKIVLASALVLWSLVSTAQNIPKRPNPPKLVNDFANVLTPDEERRLEQQLVAYDDSTSNQIAIVTLQTLNDYPIEEFALRLFRDWGIGNKSTNNGVLILAVMGENERKLRIEVGYGLEGAIPDITASHIIQNDLVPNFRSKDYYEGFSRAAASIIKAAAGEYKAPAGYNKRGKSGRSFPLGLIIFIVIMVVLFSGGGRGGGGGFMSRRGSGWLGPFIIGSMMGRSSGGWGGGGSWGGGGGGWSGGGGFGGFGGGSSGGGGASGSW